MHASRFFRDEQGSRDSPVRVALCDQRQHLPFSFSERRPVARPVRGPWLRGDVGRQLDDVDAGEGGQLLDLPPQRTATQRRRDLRSVGHCLHALRAGVPGEMDGREPPESKRFVVRMRERPPLRCGPFPHLGRVCSAYSRVLRDAGGRHGCE